MTVESEQFVDYELDIPVKIWVTVYVEGPSGLSRKQLHERLDAGMISQSFAERIDGLYSDCYSIAKDSYNLLTVDDFYSYNEYGCHID